jgi:hypothetical protein
MSDTTPNRKHQALLADVMELARGLYISATVMPKEAWIEGAAHELTAYGDRRAREARAAAIEEAAKTYRYIIAQCGIPDPDEACRQILATCLRALTDVPPRPEGGEG